MLEVSIPLFLHYKSLIKLRLFCIVVEEQSYSDEAFLKCKEMLWSGISSWAFSNNVIAHYLFVGTPPLAKKKKKIELRIDYLWQCFPPPVSFSLTSLHTGGPRGPAVHQSQLTFYLQITFWRERKKRLFGAYMISTNPLKSIFTLI